MGSAEIFIDLVELNQLALWNRVPFGKFKRASAFPVRRRRTAGSFNMMAGPLVWLKGFRYAA